MFLSSGLSLRMGMTETMTALTFAVSILVADSAPFRQRVVATTTLPLDQVIVGRASCGSSTWLLTDAPALIQVKAGGTASLGSPVRGLGRDERPWGLACVADAELWTLADYRTLARLSVSGDVVLRTKLRQPRLNVFGVGELLLLQQPPTAADLPLLAAVRPRDVNDVNRTQPWPGPTSLSQAAHKTDVPSGLVSCGLGYQTLLPCWITTQTRITVSDGARSRTSVVQPGFLTDTTLDSTTPLWDVAVAPSSALWILTSAASGEAGRRVGGRLTRSNLRGENLGSVELRPRARLILSASDRAVTLLTVAGTIVEVTAP
jgi:hypothetical protein